MTRAADRETSVPAADAVADENASTRDRLLDAAIEIASRDGQDRVTYRSVGERVGVSHSLVRFHFGTREALMAEAFEVAARRDVTESRTLAETIEEFSSGLLATIAGNTPRYLLQFDYLLAAARGAAPVKHVVDLYEEYIAHVSGTLRNVGISDPDGIYAATVFAALDGLVLQHAIYRDPDRTEKMLAVIREILALLGDKSGPGDA